MPKPRPHRTGNHGCSEGCERHTRVVIHRLGDSRLWDECYRLDARRDHLGSRRCRRRNIQQYLAEQGGNGLRPGREFGLGCCGLRTRRERERYDVGNFRGIHDHAWPGCDPHGLRREHAVVVLRRNASDAAWSHGCRCIRQWCIRRDGQLGRHGRRRFSRRANVSDERNWSR